MKLISAVRGIYNSRQDEVEVEASVAKLQELANTVITTGCFFRESDRSANDHALALPELSDFCAAADKALELARKTSYAASGHVHGSSGKKLRRLGRKTSRLPQDCVMCVKDIEKEVWLYIKSSFGKMLQSTVSDLMYLGNVAFNHDGWVEADGLATPGVINLEELQEQVSCKFALESGLLERPIATALSVRPLMVELSDLAKRVFRVLRVALVETCPKVAAMYDAPIDDMELKKLADDIDISRFFESGSDWSLAPGQHIRHRGTGKDLEDC